MSTEEGGREPGPVGIRAAKGERSTTARGKASLDGAMPGGHATFGAVSMRSSCAPCPTCERPCEYVKVTFLGGTSLRPLPPVESGDPNTRYFHIHEDGRFDEEHVTSWIKQASELPGDPLF